MKKRIGIILITALVAVSAFALTACGGLSGAEIDSDTYGKAVTTFTEKLEAGGVKIESTATVKAEETEEETIEYKSESSKKKLEVNFSKTTTDITVKSTIIVEENKAYFKTEYSTDTKIETALDKSYYITGVNNNSTVTKTILEYYVEKIENDMYIIEKDLSGKWIATSKDTYTDTAVTVAKEKLSTMLISSGIQVTSLYKFDNFEYSGGRYNLKQSVIDDEHKAAQSESTDTDKYTYTYGNNSRYIVFNSDKLYSGCAEEADGTETLESTNDNTYAKTTVKTTSSAKSLSQIAVSYNQKVSIPSYTK